jgi:hypothetical protein
MGRNASETQAFTNKLCLGIGTGGGGGRVIGH